MWFDDILEIQMLQSRLTIYADARQYSRICDDLFEQKDGISVQISQEILGIPDVDVRGMDEVRSYYRKQDVLVRENLDFLGANLSCSQRIVLSEAGNLGYGTWYTYREDVLGPAFGREKPPYPYQLSVGRYDNVFAKTPVGWRIRSIHWRPVIKLNTYETTEGAEGKIRANVQDWPMPWERYADRIQAGVRGGQETRVEAEDIAYCEAVLSIRNRIGEFCACWNSGDIAGIPERFFARDGAFFRQGMPAAAAGMENIQKVFLQMQARAKRLGGIPGIVLTTSGVIEPDAPEGRAKASWTLLTLDVQGVEPSRMERQYTKEKDADGKSAARKDTEEGSSDDGGNFLNLENHTGRWYVDWIWQEDTWKIADMKWVNFARMSDLKGRLV